MRHRSTRKTRSPVGGGLPSATALATLFAAVGPAFAAPAVSIDAAPTSVANGEPTTVTWSSTDAKWCTASGSWSGQRSLSGSDTLYPQSNSTYTLTCGRGNHRHGETATASAEVTVGTTAPTVSLSADPTSIAPGQLTKLTWSSTNSTDCAAAGGTWTGVQPTSGSASVAPTDTTTYSLTCTGSSGSGAASTTVTVLEKTTEGYEGFGASTPGGSGQPVVHVTNLDDFGPGSLREALSGGNRNVVFDVAGTIRGGLTVGGSYVTIDGLSAPSPGITIEGGSGDALGLGNNHDIVVRGLRIRGASNDGIHVGNNSAPGRVYNVVIDHVSVDGSGDGNIDVTGAAHDVTVSWSILSGCLKNMLVKYEPQRVTLHHNIFVNSQWRNPWVNYSDQKTPNLSPGTEVDMRNNVVWYWGDSGGGTGVECGAKVNLVNNLYSSPNTSSSRQARAIILKTSCTIGDGGYLYTSGNYDPDPNMGGLNSKGNESAAFHASAVTTKDACTAAGAAVLGAGVRPLDAVDEAVLSGIRLPATCP